MMEDDGELSSGRRAGKSESAFRTISEVADELDVPQHVLRFWEGKFPQVKPLKRGGGRRYYRPEDVTLLKRIRDLLYSEGYTIKGVQKLLKEGSGPSQAPVARPAPRPETQLGLSIESPGGLGLADDDDDDEVETDIADDGDMAGTEAPESGLPVVREARAPAISGGLDPDLRGELEDILEELEQLQGLLLRR